MPRSLALKRLCKTPPNGSPTEKSRHVNTCKESAEGYLCASCGKQFKRKGRLEIHERLHTGEHPFVCPSCNKGFRSKESLTNHAAVHTSDRRFHCDECSLSFKTAHQLSKHRRLMELAQSKKEPNHHCPVKCKLCDYLITSKSIAKVHASEHERGIIHKKRAGPYMCSLCKESFQNPQQLSEHYRQGHDRSVLIGKDLTDNQLDCLQCRRIFSDTTSISDQQKPFGCRLPRFHQVPRCSQATRSSHTCHRCGKKFPKSANLGKHLATHFEMDPYSCDTCKAEFKDESSYLAHNCPKRSAGPILVVKIASEMGATHPGLQESYYKYTTQTTGSSDSFLDKVSQQQLCLNITHPPVEREENLQSSIEKQLGNPCGEINLQVPMNKLVSAWSMVSASKPVMVVKFLGGKD